MQKAWLHEIFSSIQGEGVLVGKKQIFLRFSGCNLDCYYCDTKSSHDRVTELKIIEKDKERKLTNPINLKNLYNEIIEFDKKFGPHHSISFTGGEPLVQADFIKELMKLLKPDFKLFLETNGSLYNNLSKVIDLVDYVSMDVKILQNGMVQDKKSNLKFIDVAKNKLFQIKLVVSNTLDISSITDIFEEISLINKNIPIIIQPAMSETCEQLVENEKLLKLYDILSQNMNDIRIIPQTHKFLAII